MKKTDIFAGGAYTDGKGNVRQVLRVSTTGEFKLYSTAVDPHTLQFRLVHRSSGFDGLGKVENSSVASFAAWCKGNIGPGGIALEPLDLVTDQAVIRAQLWNWEANQGRPAETEVVSRRQWDAQVNAIEKAVLADRKEAPQVGRCISDFIVETRDAGANLLVRKGWRNAAKTFKVLAEAEPRMGMASV